MVWKESYEYKITQEEIEEYTFGENFEENREKIHYYEPYTWSEARLMRHSKKLKWNENEKSPKRRGLTFPKQIKVKHYQFRNPDQMKRRQVIRIKAKEDGCGSFKHEQGEHWKDYLRPRDELFCQQPDNTLPRLGARNRHNRIMTRISKWILTIMRYY